LTGYSGSFQYISKIYRNNGNNTFTEQTGILLTGVCYSSVAWGDYDNDGDLDIILTGSAESSNITKIYKNNGNNTFTEQTGIAIPGVFGGTVAWGDYDNDGDLDVLLTGYSSSKTYISKIYRNNGDNTFSEQTGITLTGVGNGSVAWGDYNNDGYLDILLTGYTNTTFVISKIYKNNGNNTFTEQSGISLKGVDKSSVAWGDYDNDGDLDILLTGAYVSKIYKNESVIKNTPPSSPYNLKQNVSNNNVTLNWDKATDDETPQNRLSYNLLIQTIDGKITKGPLSDNSSGIRKVVTIGNVGQLNTWTIKDLPAGIYSWSVQTIDQSYAGSTFAPSRIFSVGNPVVLDKPKTPEGATIFCSSYLNSEYAINSVPGATLYCWSINPPNAGVISGNSITALVDWTDNYLGIAKISVIAINTKANYGISASSDSLIVALNTKPEKPIITKTGTVLQSSATSGNQWYKQDALIPGADQQELTSTGDGNYYVIVTEEGCPSDPSDAFIVTDIETIVSKRMVDVYPNPVAKNLTIVPVDNNKVSYEFIDLLGKLVKKGSISGKTVIETGSFIPGIYLLKINNGKTTEFIKISKE
jgi:predicted nucleotidyltransferase